MHLCEQIPMPNLALGREVPVGLHAIFHMTRSRDFLYSTDIGLDHCLWHACTKIRRENEWCHQRNNRRRMQAYHHGAETLFSNIKEIGRRH